MLAIDAIKEELRDRIEFFQKNGKLLEAQRIEQRTRFDLEMLAEMGFCKGIENYSRHLSGRNQGERPPTLLAGRRSGSRPACRARAFGDARSRRSSSCW